MSFSNRTIMHGYTCYLLFVLSFDSPGLHSKELFAACLNTLPQLQGTTLLSKSIAPTVAVPLSCKLRHVTSPKLQIDFFLVIDLLPGLAGW